MGIVFVRTIILYASIIIALRLMGKRQIGEMQPTELVITLLIAEVAAVPMQSNGIPMIYGLISIIVLVSLEVILSFLSLKCPPFQKLLSGNSSIVVEDGRLNQAEMRRQRFSLSDLCEELRLQKINRIADISYAVLETGGKLSVFLRPEASPPTKKELSIPSKDVGVVRMLVSDGKINRKDAQALSMDEAAVLTMIQQRRLTLDQVFYLSVDAKGNLVELVKKEIS
ncbi:MAG: DUF421 domain-containing protein [Clostridiales bacterium]|nr:DUF421 domain-containing protein [Clostridiales bacterium]